MKKCPKCDGEMNRLRHLVRDEAKYKCASCGNRMRENTRYRKEKVPSSEPFRTTTFTLTDTESPACHGTSFPSLAAARDYAISLREFGLCMSFSIGCYGGGRHFEVYRQVGEEQVKDTK
jgi:NAD-dependent SIR2 family protein deacetylase